MTLLSNGARIVVFERPDTPVSMNVNFMAGSRYDPLGKEGASHFLEHMLMAGNKRFPTGDKIFEYIQKLGGRINAGTGKELMGIEVSIGESSDLEKAVSVVSDIILTPLFSFKAFELERNTILKEIGMSESSPGGMLGVVSLSNLFQNTVLERSVLGYKETVSRVLLEDLISHYRSMIAGNRMVLVVCGGVEFERVRDLFEKYLQVPRGQKLVLKKKELPAYRKKAVRVWKFSGLDQVYLSFDFRTVSSFHSDIVSLSIIKSVLAGGMFSRLYKKLRIEKGLVYSVDTDVGSYIDGGFFGAVTSTSNSNVQEVLDIITNEIKRIEEKGITKKELGFVKRRRLKSIKLGLQTSDSWVSRHEYTSMILRNKLWTLEDDFEELEKVSLEDIKRVAKKYFRSDNWYLTMCGDIEESDVSVSL